VSLLILVVDDESDVEMLFRQQFRRDLRSGRFTMEFAQSADSALQRISDAAGASLILILSDINMPGMSGLELLPKAKALRPDVPVIMITAYGDDQTKRKALEGGAEALLTKPIDFVALRDEIDSRVAGAGADVRSGSKAEKLQTSICLPLCRQERTSPLRPANCITPRPASTVSIRADVPRPSSETTASVIGETMRLALWPKICIGRKPLNPAVSR
jgi:CheY-like chemotaxis protein